MQFRSRQKTTRSYRAFGKSIWGAIGLVLVAAPVTTFAQCISDSGGGGFAHMAFRVQTSTFSSEFDATPSVAPIDAGTGFSDDPTNQFAATSTFVRFSPAGVIDARNGGVFAAASKITYAAGLSYHFRMDVDVPNATYSIWVRLPGKSTNPLTLIGKDFAFRTSANNNFALDNLATEVNQRSGTITVCNLVVTATAPPVPIPDCTIVVPDYPLTAAGLSTPFRLKSSDPDDGACHESDAAQSAFVQASILDTDTGQITTYAPLVIDDGTTPAVAPVVPKLPVHNVVALWFGFNGNNLKQEGNHDWTLAEAGCVNGFVTLFGQYSYCNAPAFFVAANRAISEHKLVVPALGNSPAPPVGDGQLCPSVRSFTVVDQDQSDNVPSTFLLTTTGKFAQNTAANRALLVGATVHGNPSDNRLVDVLLDPALGCKAWMVADLADPGALMPSPALNELQAAAFQTAPVGLMPLNDPMTVINGNASLTKTNLYRIGVDQPIAFNNNDASGTTYCQNFRNIHPTRLLLDKALLSARPSPFPDQANSLFTFMAMRAVASYQLLGCQDLLHQPDRISVTTDANGIVVSATIN